MREKLALLDYAFGPQDFSSQAGDGQRRDFLNRNPFAAGEHAVAAWGEHLTVLRSAPQHMNSVIGNGDGMPERARVSVARQVAGRIGPLRQFPHACHERQLSRPLYQPHCSVAMFECAPDLLLLLAWRWFSPSHFSLRGAPWAKWANQTARFAGQAHGRAQFHHGLIKVAGPRKEK